MKRLFYGLAAACAMMGSSASFASVIDVNQPEGLSFNPYGATHSLAQTFTAGFSMKLDKIDVRTDSWAGDAKEQLTISVLKVDSSGAPNGMLLGSISFADAPAGLWSNGNWVSIDMSAANVFLDGGAMYALMFESSFAGNPDYGNAIGFSGSGDIYAGGALWEKIGDGAWALESSWISGGVPGVSDLTFKTYGTAVVVPVPASIWTVMAGALALAALRRRKFSLH